MDNEGFKSRIGNWADDLVFEEGAQFLNVVAPPEKLYAIARQLKDDPETSLDYLFCLTGVDWPEYFEVVYHLESTRHAHSLVLRTRTDGRENPRLDTVCTIWPTAEAHEREVYDLFGIHFANHPDLRRLLLTDDWEGYPLRKDYKDEINIVEL